MSALLKSVVNSLSPATLVTREDISALKSPVSIAFLENDQLFPQEILDDGKKHLEENKVDHEIKTYSGVPHGKSIPLPNSTQELQANRFHQVSLSLASIRTQRSRKLSHRLLSRCWRG